MMLNWKSKEVGRCEFNKRCNIFLKAGLGYAEVAVIVIYM